MMLIDASTGGPEKQPGPVQDERGQAGPARSFLLSPARVELASASAFAVDLSRWVRGGYCAEIAPGMSLSPVGVGPKRKIGYLSIDRLASDLADRLCTWHWLVFFFKQKTAYEMPK